jgi:hypothetical protein
LPADRVRFKALEKPSGQNAPVLQVFGRAKGAARRAFAIALEPVGRESKVRWFAATGGVLHGSGLKRLERGFFVLEARPEVKGGVGMARAEQRSSLSRSMT